MSNKLTSDFNFVANAVAFGAEDILEEENRLLTRNYVPESAKPISVSALQVVEDKYTASASVGNNTIQTQNFRRVATPKNGVLINWQPTFYHGSINNDNILPSSTNTLSQGNYQIKCWATNYVPIIDEAQVGTGMALTMALTNTSGATQTIIFEQKFKYFVNDGGVITNA